MPKRFIPFLLLFLIISIPIVSASPIDDFISWFKNILFAKTPALETYYVPVVINVTGRYEVWVDTNNCDCEVFDHVAKQECDDQYPALGTDCDAYATYNWSPAQVNAEIPIGTVILISGSEGGIRNCLGEDIWNTYLNPALQTTTTTVATTTIETTTTIEETTTTVPETTTTVVEATTITPTTTIELTCESIAGSLGTCSALSEDGEKCFEQLSIFGEPSGRLGKCQMFGRIYCWTDNGACAITFWEKVQVSIDNFFEWLFGFFK